MTLVPPGPLADLWVWPTGQPQPAVSTLHSFGGSIVANAAIVPAGTDGAINVNATGPTDLVIDIAGYFAPPVDPGALYLYPVTPCRIVDTRVPSGVFWAPSLAAGSFRDFPLPASPCGTPNIAQAYSLNMTVVPPGPLSYLTTWASGQPQPYVSTLNSYLGRIVANAAVVTAGTNGAISVFVTNTTDLVIDINGYFAQ